jgi:hypothetical protein
LPTYKYTNFSTHQSSNRATHASTSELSIQTTIESTNDKTDLQTDCSTNIYPVQPANGRTNWPAQQTAINAAFMPACCQSYGATHPTTNITAFATTFGAAYKHPKFSTVFHTNKSADDEALISTQRYPYQST